MSAPAQGGPSGEFRIIRRIREVIGPHGPRVLRGIGDDAAVLQAPQGKLLATIDMLVEGVHFDLRFARPQELGHKALAVNLSDIAAMGGTPLYALVSLGLRPGLNEDFVAEVYAGMHELARRQGLDLVGGDTVRSPQSLVIDISVLGETSGPAIERRGARPGELVCVSGPLGSSAAGLELMKQLGRSECEDRGFGDLIGAHLLPRPRLAEARALAAAGPSAMIDISDGLSSELHHLAEESQTGFVIDQAALPRHGSLESAAQCLDRESLDWILHGGEDYELLLTLPAGRLSAARAAIESCGASLHVIGEVRSAAEGVQIKRMDGRLESLPSGGFNHFPEI